MSAAGAQARPAGRWLQVLAAAGCIAFLTLVWAAILFHIDSRRNIDLSQARQDAPNLSAALAEQVSRLIENADQILRLIQEDFHHDPATFDVAVWMKRATALNANTKRLAILDAAGIVTAVHQLPSPSDPGVDIADRASSRCC